MKLIPAHNFSKFSLWDGIMDHIQFCLNFSQPTQKAFVASSAKFDGFTASQIETHKNQKYRQKIVEGGYIFYPLVAETYGRRGHSMDEFLATLAKHAACRSLRRSLLEAA
eukprot:Platyproteum_vivax@DN7202_c0_g1_i2.p1